MEIAILLVFAFIFLSLFGGSKKRKVVGGVMANQSEQLFTCRYCGLDLQASGAVSYCSHGPGHKHELIAKSENYVCKFCGMKLQNTMARGHCVRSASKTHVLINAKPSYTCRYCGQTSKDSNFVISHCKKGPNHQHELIE